MKGYVYGKFTNRRPQVFDPLGHCMYCGDTNASGLSREHIIPIGLGNGCILPSSSCEACRKITHEFETICLRQMLLAYRLPNKLVRNLKDLPKTVPPHFSVGEMQDYMAPEDLPPVIQLPMFKEPPGILVGKKPDKPFGAFSAGVFADRNKVSLPPKEGRMSLRRPNLQAFIRMLAKIAHGTCVGNFGPKVFKPLLPDLILGRNLALGPHLVGNWSGRGPGGNPFHEVGMAAIPWSDKWLLVTHIRLMNNIENVPGYEVVAGVLDSVPEKLLPRPPEDSSKTAD